MLSVKKLLFVLVGISFLVLMENCKSDEGNPTESATSSLVGTWVLTKITVMNGAASIEMTPAQAQIESTIIARADGTYTGTIIQQGVVTTESGTWSSDGKKITFKMQDGTVRVSDYTLTGNKLVVSQNIPTPLGAETPANLEFTRQ
ncbi:MAG: lipocalin-like domain-containing protein [Melioribacteraceae bacterium]